MIDLARDIIGTQPILAVFLAIGVGYLDDRFHGSCHNRGIHLWFQAPYMWRGGVEAKD